MTADGRVAVQMSQAAIIGAACRLPGARDADALWRLLLESRCAVGPLPAGRWQAERYLHPRLSEPGFSYSFAGGYIDDPLAFDPIVFGISPREAAEMDPQQRLLLEVIWTALEDGGIPPSALAGANVGVYVGASSLDYGNLHTTDPASIESHFMTGNTLSILSNRISYAFDLRGPSFTIDTACSSSLVAFAEAQAAISSGRIDMAIVAGVNLLMSPTSFIGFSRASMLSPSGLCRPFSAQADGYVRAEGAVAVVLAKLETAIDRDYPIRAVALASGLNSDGRTNGIALPSAEGQRSLLDRLYIEAGIDPASLAFVEAHGTGTRVGDPAEAAAIGQALGQRRAAPLPIGSVKSNIGHLEPAAGLAGLLKAVLALEHRVLPPTLHLQTVNPAIDFAALNLSVAREALALPVTGTWLAGISSFGFGGTNAHVVLRQPEACEQPGHRLNGRAGRPAGLLVLSAHSRQALSDTARAYADRFAAGEDVARTASAVAWQRDLAGHRAAWPISAASGPAEMESALRHFADTGHVASGLAGIAPSSPPKTCFVYTGNGCVWAGMGRAAFAAGGAFRQHFQAIDAIFGQLADWSLVEALHDDTLAARLKQTRIAQPLLFAVQSALTASLDRLGLRPDMVLGHSVGEVAAAEACGALSLDEAVRVIFHRSEQQETMRGLGGMAVAAMPARDCTDLIESAGLDGLEIAAINSPSAVTISGPDEAIRAFARLARKRRVAVVPLDLAYPFHSALLRPLRTPLLQALGDVDAEAGDQPFISTVTAAETPGQALTATYWWRNVREPVRFQEAIEAAARLGATLFIEVGPRPILSGNISDTLREAGLDGAVIATLTEKEIADPLTTIAARAMVHGCRPNRESLFGARPHVRSRLPPYAWQRTQFGHKPTSEAVDLYGIVPRHSLIGARLVDGGSEWRNLIDSTVIPYLADHRIDGEIIVPGTVFAEMALAVAREMFPAGPIGLEDFDLLQWMPLAPDSMRELSVRLSGDTHIVEIRSRPRLAANEWTLHARGRITQIASAPPAFVPPPELPRHLTAVQVYDSATAAGVQYGPSFRRVIHADRSDTEIEVALSPIEDADGPMQAAHTLHPIALDAAFHSMFEGIKPRADERYAYLPVRFASLRVDQDSASPARARIVVDRETDESITVSIALYDSDGVFIAGLTGGLLRAVVLDRHRQSRPFFQQQQIRLVRQHEPGAALGEAVGALQAGQGQTPPDSWLLLGAFARSLAHDRLRAAFGDGAFRPGPADPARPLVQALAEHLAAAGLARETESGWVLAAESGLPPPADILRSFAGDEAAATPEIVLAAQALFGLQQALTAGVPIQTRSAVLELFESSSILFAPLLAAVRAVCEALETRIAPEPLRVLVVEPSCQGLLRVLAPLVQQRRAVVTVICADARRLQQAAARQGATAGVTFLAASEPAGVGAGFDVALGFAFGPVFGGDGALGRALSHRLSPNGLLLTLVPPDNLIFDLLAGTGADWFSGLPDADFPIGRVGAAQHPHRAISAAGFADLRAFCIGDGMGSVIVASPEMREAADTGASPVLLIDGGGSLLSEITRAVRANGGMPRIVDPAALAEAWQGLTRHLAPDGVADMIVAPTLAGSGLDAAIADLAAILDVVQHGQCRLWVAVRGLEAAGGGGIEPVAEAVWCFARVAMNEYPSVDIRLVDIALGMDEADAGMALAAHLASPGAESEILIDTSGILAIRVVPGLHHVGGDTNVPAARLSLRQRGLQASFDWVAAARRAPEPAEIEVEIAACGLNFRDVMLASGLLDDDVLDDGLAGAVFGFECAGRVLRVGSDVANLAPGDAVMGFGRESFATHCTADARVFTRVPDAIGVEEAATIPVAFLTAWYALVHQARIQPGEWVLIHGAAGGVGLAAIQIARLFGARVAATVSAPDKRAVAELFGAERVYNSRSTAFLDVIRADLGGVDVVLNSLAGEAMQASVKCLKPFGRFIELGKRDYVANTALGLRPFRRNLTYFGVDLDQLLAANLPMAQRLMADLARHFADGALTPLPYRMFDWFDTGRAFQSMQAAGHVGKLLVRPASPPVATSVTEAPFRPGLGAHLVVGGTGGFGFEAAAWLAALGARTVIVASRSGRIAPALQSRANAIREAGTTLIAETLDVTDEAAVQALLTRLQAKYGRLAGVMHTAMVLDDGKIAGLEPARTRAVLAPKVDGAANLDRATRGAALDYFVVFSSATTMVGNPGQSAYVAANGYLQGLMRQRRAACLPGLAVAWGAIADAGVLARNRDVADKLERVSGIVAMPAGEALGHLGALLARGNACPAVVTCAVLRPGSALQSLKLLRTPALAALFESLESGGESAEIDLASELHGKSDGESRAVVARLVAAEVARIFRLSPEDVDLARPLDQLGLDSMMSIDLRMGIEQRFGVELPVVAISAGVSVNDLASRLLAGLRADAGDVPDDAAELHLMQQHGAGDVDPATLRVLAEAVRERDSAAALL